MINKNIDMSGVVLEAEENLSLIRDTLDLVGTSDPELVLLLNEAEKTTNNIINLVERSTAPDKK